MELGGLTNLVSVEADYNLLKDIADLEHLPHLSRAGLVGNLLDLSTDSPVSAVIQNLQSRQVSVAYQPQNQPPNLSLPTRWFIATNLASSHAFYVYDDITPGDQLLITASSSDTSLIPDQGFSITGTNENRTLTLTPAADQTGTTTITLTATDDAGLITSVDVLVSVMIPEVVTFPDPNLATAIQQTLGRPAGDLTSLELQSLTYLYVYNTNIADLSGLEWATNLSSLFLNGNSISNLSVLPALPGLRFFSLNNNSVADLSSLTALTNLTGLGLHGDAINDLTFLQSMSQLTWLSLETNRITDLAPLAGLMNLEFLSLRQNLLTNIGPIQDLPQLSYVNLTLNLLNVNSSSPDRTAVDGLQARGVLVGHLPQRRPPTFSVLTNWLVAADTTSWLGFSVLDDGPSGDLITVTASSSDTNLMPAADLAVSYVKNTYWLLTGTPTSDQTGTATITLNATDDAGLTNRVTIPVTVVSPLPLEGVLCNSTDLVWQTGGNAAWFGQTNGSRDGVSAARSGSLGDNQESWLETTVTGPGILSFWWKVSSETGFDFLKFYIDGVLQTNRISGEVNWRQVGVNLVRGVHTLRWRYAKDRAVSSGSDAAWLDQVTFVPLSWLELSGPPTNGQCQLLLHVIPGKVYEVLASTNLLIWFSLGVISPTNTAMPFVDPAPDSRACFYRLREVPASSVWFEKPDRPTNGSMQLVVHGPPGARLELQASTNLLTWSVLATVTNSFGTVTYSDPLGANPSRRFYRAAVVP
ncbi:MAG: hypothetical protein HY298_01420 [Verrucomicrobia bacterium]|nr:hypothetical protein [Verrucomicrobiota bacterium]